MQLEIPTVVEARQRLTDELQQELHARVQQKSVVVAEIRALTMELRRLQKSTNAGRQRRGQKDAGQAQQVAQ